MPPQSRILCGCSSSTNRGDRRTSTSELRPLCLHICAVPLPHSQKKRGAEIFLQNKIVIIKKLTSHWVLLWAGSFCRVEHENKSRSRGKIFIKRNKKLLRQQINKITKGHVGTQGNKTNGQYLAVNQGGNSDMKKIQAKKYKQRERG